MSSIWIHFLILVFSSSHLFFQSCIVRSPPRFAQTDPGWISKKTEVLWHSTGQNLIKKIQKKRSLIFQTLLAEKKKLKSTLEIDEPTEAEIQTQGTYGQVPQVFMDQNFGAIFPVPIASPFRMSWYQIVQGSIQILQQIEKLEQSLMNWRKLEPQKQLQGFENIISHWMQINQSILSEIQNARYLEAWTPKLSTQHQWVNEQVVRAFFDPQSILLNSLQVRLRPRRVTFPPYLPESLKSVPAGILVLPITTDITHQKFLAEVEGALDTHWNHSTWARSNQILFVIQWSFIQKNFLFAQGLESLDQHVAHFPKNRASLTTGGLTTHVKGSTIVLGPGKITPRTIAHEIGHLFGFNDCYLRTMTAQGLFGIGLLEWDNPLYPDDLMCDNLVGEAHSEIW